MTTVVPVLLAAAIVFSAQIGTSAPQAAPPRFEVASVRANNSGERGTYAIQESPGGLNATNASLFALIAWAYEVTQYQFLSVPDWTRTARFDIAARTSTPSADTTQSEATRRRMALRTLLAERFALVVRHEMREVPLLALVMARPDGRPGPQLRRSVTDCSPQAIQARADSQTRDARCGGRMSLERIVFVGASLSAFAAGLSPFDGRVVVDRTGLTGTWDLDVTFRSSVLAPVPGSSAVDPPAAPLSTALQEQLGLKLEPIRDSVEVLVVERIEMPTDN